MVSFGGFIIINILQKQKATVYMCSFQSNRPSVRPIGNIMVDTGNTSCNEADVANVSNWENAAPHQVITAPTFYLRDLNLLNIISFASPNRIRQDEVVLRSINTHRRALARMQPFSFCTRNYESFVIKSRSEMNVLCNSVRPSMNYE